MTLKEKIECMQAFERGEEVEVSYVKQAKWTDISNPDWSWGAYNYRIKPKPKQVIVIEKWLCKSYIGDNTVHAKLEVQKGFIEDWIDSWHDSSMQKVKLLDTYEVEL